MPYFIESLSIELSAPAVTLPVTYLPRAAVVRVLQKPLARLRSSAIYVTGENPELPLP